METHDVKWTWYFMLRSWLEKHWSELNFPADNPKHFLMYTWPITTITINSEQELKLKLIKNKPNKRESKGPKAN